MLFLLARRKSAWDETDAFVEEWFQLAAAHPNTDPLAERAHHMRAALEGRDRIKVAAASARASEAAEAHD